MRDLTAYEGLQTKVSLYAVRERLTCWILLFVQLASGLLNKKKYEQIKFKNVNLSLCKLLCALYMQEDELNSFRESIEAVDQNRPPLKSISGYSILDHLGTGAFGSVFKVR